MVTDYTHKRFVFRLIGRRFNTLILLGYNRSAMSTKEVLFESFKEHLYGLRSSAI